MDPNDRIAELIIKHLNGTISETETEELSTWRELSNENRSFFEKYNHEEFISTELRKLTSYDVAASWEKLVERAGIPRSRPRVVRFRWILTAAAAAILIAALLTWIFITPKPDETTKATPAEVAYKNDVQPGGDHARLTLADGRVIVLDSVSNGASIQQGNVKVIKLQDGNLKYEVGSRKSEAVSPAITFNTLSTPRGGQYQLVLPDGSKVWLNAASSIRYPTLFAGKERSVEVTGELYFEIEKNPKKPFRVYFPSQGRGGGMIEVLGTHFNINAYSDEDAVEATLLEGKIKITSGNEAPVKTPAQQTANKSQTLLPGQQVKLTENGQIKIASDIDVDETVAWKEGYFQFRNANIESILRQVSRWYDVNVQYESKPTEGLSGRIPRSVPVSKLLQLLEATGGVRFGIDGKTIIVKK